MPHVQRLNELLFRPFVCTKDNVTERPSSCAQAQSLRRFAQVQVNAPQRCYAPKCRELSKLRGKETDQLTLQSPYATFSQNVPNLVNAMFIGSLR